MTLSPEDRQRIYEEEKIKEEARLAAQASAPMSEAEARAKAFKAIGDASNSLIGCGCLVLILVLFVALFVIK